MTPLDYAVEWVQAGDRAGPEREALLRAVYEVTEHGIRWHKAPAGRDVYQERKALALWKRAAKRKIAATATRGAPVAPRVPRMVMVTERIAAKLDRGEAVTITGATLAVTP